VALLEQAVAESRAIRLLYGYASLVTSLGEACLGDGQLDEASRLAAEAVALARERGERGDEGWALHLSAEIAARRDPPDVTAEATVAYRKALAIAEALEMRPLAARCHLGFGALLGAAGESSGADPSRAGQSCSPRLAPPAGGAGRGAVGRIALIPSGPPAVRRFVPWDRDETEVNAQGSIDGALRLGRDASGAPDHAIAIVGHHHGGVCNAGVRQRGPGRSQVNHVAPGGAFRGIPLGRDDRQRLPVSIGDIV
jgi:hypothetical protein